MAPQWFVFRPTRKDDKSACAAFYMHAVPNKPCPPDLAPNIWVPLHQNQNQAWETYALFLVKQKQPSSLGFNNLQACTCCQTGQHSHTAWLLPRTAT